MKNPFMKCVSLLLSLLMAIEAGAVPLSQSALLKSPRRASVVQTEKKRPISQKQSVSLARQEASSVFTVPPSMGEMAEMSASDKSGRLVYHIQDIHDDLSAQANLSGLISGMESYAADRNKSLVVLTEGSSGPLDSDSIASMPDKKTVHDVAVGLLNAGYLFGEELAAVTHAPGRINIVGIETPSLYKQNGTARDDSKIARERVLVTIRDIKSQLQKLVPHNFNAVLSELEELRAGVEKGNGSVADYVAFLNKSNPALIQKFPSLAHVLTLSAQEKKINFDRVESERGKILKEIAQKGTQRDTDQLLERTTALKEGRLSPSSYYSSLLARSDNTYPSLKSYVAYLNEAETIKDTDRLFGEIEQAQTEVASALIKHPMVEDLYRHLRWIERQEKFFSLQMIPQEWNQERNQNIRSIFTEHKAIQDFVKEQVGDLGYQFSTPSFSLEDLKVAEEGARSFYRLAEARDTAMTQNLMAALQTFDAKRYEAVLIAGGFHTPGINKQLKANGVGYAVIRPQIETDIKLTSPYDYGFLRSRFENLKKSYQHVSTYRAPGALVAPDVVKELVANPTQMPPSLAKQALAPRPISNSFLKQLADLVNPKKAHALDITTLFSLAMGLLIYAPIVLGSIIIQKAAEATQNIQPAGKRQLPLSPHQIRQAESSALLLTLSRQNLIDSPKMSQVTDYVSAMNLPVLYVADNDLNMFAAEEENVRGKQPWANVKNANDPQFVLSIPAKFLRNDTPDRIDFPLTNWEAAQQYSKQTKTPLTKEAFTKLASWEKDRQDAAKAFPKAAHAPSKYHDQQIDRVNADRLNRALNNRDFQNRVFAEDESLFRDKDNKLSALPNELPILFQSWYNDSHNNELPLAARNDATKKMKKVVGIASALPQIFDPKNFSKPLLPAEQDLARKPGFKGNLTFHDVNTDGTVGADNEHYQALPNHTKGEIRNAVAESRRERDRWFYSGRSVRRVFFGGAWRRGGIDKPAALVTPQDVANAALKDGVTLTLPPLADVPLIDRYILQMLADVVEIAERNGWPVDAGLANQQFIITLSEGNAPLVEKHLVDVNFYGLPPENVMIVLQRSGTGYKVENQTVNPSPEGLENRTDIEVGPYGHLEIELKHNFANEWFTLDKNGVRHTRGAPLYSYLISQNKFIRHHQASLNNAMKPGWTDSMDRSAIMIAALEKLGYSTMFEFRQDASGDKGGMTALSNSIDPETAKFLGVPAASANKPNVVTIETNRTQVKAGDAIKQELAGATINASVTDTNPAALQQVVEPAKFSFNATVRGKKVKEGEKEFEINATIHPDGVSYEYFNMLDSKFMFVPVEPRREMKQPKEFPNFEKDAAAQDTMAGNEAYQRPAAMIQEGKQVSIQDFSKPLNGSLGIPLTLVFGIGWIVIVGAIWGFAGDAHSSMAVAAMFPFIPIPWKKGPTTPAADGTTFKDRTAPKAIGDTEVAIRQLQSAIRKLIKPLILRKANESATILINLANLPLDKSLNQNQLMAQMELALGAVSWLKGLKDKASSIQANVIAFNSDAAQTGLEEAFKALISRKGLNMKLVGHNDLKGWNGGNIAPVLQAAGIAASQANPKQTYVLSSEGGNVEGAEGVQVFNMPHLSLALFTYTHFRDAKGVLAQLMALFKTILNVELGATLSNEIQAEILSRINA